MGEFPAGAREELGALPSAEQTSLWAAFSEARREAHPIAAHQRDFPQNRGYDYFASNPGQRINARFGVSGVRFGARGESFDEAGRSGAGWEAVLRLKRVAGREVSDAVAVCQSAATKTRMEIEHAAGVTEWFENRREGFEHGFTLQRRPDGLSAGDELRIEVALDGLQARTGQAAGELEFHRDGEAVLAYSALKVLDRNGSELPARMEPTEDGFLLACHAEDGAYPVTIDPLITSQEAKLKRIDGAAGDWFGCSVALSGDTALVGAYGDDDGGSASGSAYVFVRSGTNWTLQAKLTAADAAADDNFGAAVALAGDTALVGAFQDDDGGDGSGSAYVFARSGTSWAQQAKLTAADGAAGDRFGIAVSIAGDIALVGADQDDDKGNGSGSAYVFARSGTNWTQQAKLTAADGAANDQFGVSVSVSGESVVVGSIFDDDAGTNSGSAYVFVRSGTNWTQQAKLTAADAAAGDFFGCSVALAGDTAVVGAYWEDGDGDTTLNCGSAYVFVRSGTSWTQEAKLNAADAAADDRFGISVALAGDTAVVGAFMDDDGGEVSGSAYVFERSGENWTQQAKLTAADHAPYDYFGRSVAISGDTVLVGSHYDDDWGTNCGSAYVFDRGDVGWIQQAKLTAADAAPEDLFGACVSLAGDTALVGAPGDDDAGDFSGSAYVFVRSGTNWTLQAKLAAADAAGGDVFGFSVSLAGDTALVGAGGDDNESGSAYVFVRSGTGWTQQAKLTAADAAPGDYFGGSVSVSHESALIGAASDDDKGYASGSAYVFVRSGTHWIQQAKLFAADASAGDGFGCSVSLSGDTALVGAQADHSESHVLAGSAYVFVRNGTNWTQQAKLTAADPVDYDWFGSAVSLSGDTALIGAPTDEGGSGVDSCGRAYVFVRNGTNWTQQAKLTAADAGLYDEFGRSVSLSGDTALVGANGDDDGASNSGSAYVFTRNGTDWTQQAKLTAADAAEEDYFGISVSLSGDTALVAAAFDDDMGSESGSIYVFRLQNSGVADLAVFDHLGGQVLSGGPAAPFAALPVGATQGHGFTLRNVGTLGLDIQSVSLGGADAGEFSLVVPDLSAADDLAAMQSMGFTVRFAPVVPDSRLRSATVQIASSDPDDPVFTVSISGWAFSSTTDTDGDGLNDWAEYQGRLLGLNWQLSQPALVEAFHDAADGAGLVDPEEVGGVSSSFVLISEDPATGLFSLRLRLWESPDFSAFVPMVLDPANLTVNPDGDIQYDFSSGEGKRFYQASFR